MHQSLPFEAYGRGSARCRGASGGERRASQKLRCLFFSTRLCFLFATPERESLTGVAAISRLRGFGAQCLPETSAFSTGWLDARVLLLTGKAEEETRERGGAEAASSNESILMTKALPQAFSLSLSLDPSFSRRHFFFFFPFLLTQPLLRLRSLSLLNSPLSLKKKKTFQANHHRERLLAQPHAGEEEAFAGRRGTARSGGL